MKKCSCCKTRKPLNEFNKNKRFSDGLHYNCAECANQQGKESKYRTRYGITLEEKWEMLKAQDGRCAICNRIIEGRTCVDHDHESNQVRGILCDKCNRGLGTFEDNIHFLEQAIVYIKKWNNEETT